jgi:ABC-type phosphate transport system auxiliary subunit
MLFMLYESAGHTLIQQPQGCLQDGLKTRQQALNMALNALMAWIWESECSSAAVQVLYVRVEVPLTVAVQVMTTKWPSSMLQTQH